MNSIFKSTLILGGSSLVSLFIGLLATKCWAVLLGPAGFGYLGLLQNLVTLAAMVAGMSVGTSLVRFGAEALGSHDTDRAEALRQGSWGLIWMLGSIAFVLMAVMRRPISRLMLGEDGSGLNVVLMGVALMFNLAGTIFSSLLNAHHRVAASARLNLLSRAVTAGVAVLLVLIWREQGVVAAVLGGAIASWAVSWRVCARELGGRRAAVLRPTIVAAARDLLRFGGPCTASQIVGGGVQLLVPVMVLRTMGQESVGLYRAVGLISTVYLGFLLTAMSQDYYPRISAAGGQPATLVGIVNEQHQLIILLAVPLIACVLTAAPVLVPFVYSRQFLPVVSVLEWQLIGDILKFSSWTMSFVLLARNRSGLYFLTESVAGLVTVVATWAGMRWFGLEGLGIAYVAVYLAYFLTVWCLVRREIDLRLTPMNRVLLSGGLLSACLIRLVGLCGLTSLRTPVSVVLSLILVASSVWLLHRKYGALKWIPCMVRTRRAE